MTPFLKTIFGIVAGAAETEGEIELEQVLADLHKSDPDAYKAAIAGGHLLCTHLLPKVAGSPVMKEIVTALSIAITESAEETGIDLTDPNEHHGNP